MSFIKYWADRKYDGRDDLESFIMKITEDAYMQGVSDSANVVDNLYSNNESEDSIKETAYEAIEELYKTKVSKG